MTDTGRGAPNVDFLYLPSFSSQFNASFDRDMLLQIKSHDLDICLLLIGTEIAGHLKVCLDASSICIGVAFTLRTLGEIG